MTTTTAVAVPPSIAEALRSASARTGAGFDFLLETAIRESGLETAARAATSSASGLFQFVEQTWLWMLKEAGPSHGLAAYADDITWSGRRYEVADPRARQEILALRQDPRIAALMAGELTRRNAAELAGELGREATSGELYIGHFLGARGAAALIRAASETPAAAAADMFPAAARANRSIFYDRSGAERSVSQVYARLVSRHDGAGAAPARLERRQMPNPFAGVIAFFERLFSPPPTVSARGERSAGAPAIETASSAAGPAGDGSRALAARAATAAYRAQAGAGPIRRVAKLSVEGAGPHPLVMPPPWTDSLFANAPRPAGPLVVVS